MSDITHRTEISPGPRRPGERAACVVVIHGEGLGKRYDVDASPVLIGRSRDADLLIPHQSVSRRHCQIWREADRYFLRDLGATNPTRINDIPVGTDPVPLGDGDHITIGETILKFISRSSVEALYHEEVYQLATHDPLTELCNRRHFNELLEKEIARARRHGRPLALCMIDVDHFKRVNDRFGHAEGDRVLQTIASCMREHTRIEDIVARVGGEEFSVLFPETDEGAALNFAERLRAGVERREFVLGGRPEHVTVSVGVATVSNTCDTPGLLLQAADAALYEAKEGGRNQVRVRSI
ncbi:MAG TPA: GGDEF domain-containing protein [Rhodanobacteraceae bacterium]|nr:GGDEF domain-containing protein [Rhodanobacteraceae bacterium]